MSASPARSPGARRGAGEPWLWATLSGVTALTWTLTAYGASVRGNGPGTMGRGLAGFLVLWTTMMAAMMVPTVAPLASIYLRAIASRSTTWVQAARTAALVGGYLGVWAATGVVAFGAALAGGRVAANAPAVGLWAGAGVLAMAGIYQLTPAKERCLRRCRSPLGLLLHVGAYTGRSRDLRAGLYHGGYCVGCCWALMSVLVVVGVMNLAWMVGLTLLVLVEKTWRGGRVVGVAAGVGLVGLACLVPWHPGLVPGLHVGGGMAAGGG